nr:hypothetical protein [uncultured Flavobacterium sp.]
MIPIEIIEIAKPHLENTDAVYVTKDGKVFPDQMDAIVYCSNHGVIHFEVTKEHIAPLQNNETKKNLKK